MDAAVITSDSIPAPAGPFSPALKVGEWLFLSGQGGFDPKTGRLAGGTIEEQTEQTLRNISALLGAAGCRLSHVVSCLVHLSDLSLFSRFNATYEKHFQEPRPVRTTVGASLVLGMLVEITVVARVARSESGR
jgi:2-iminobutanoate/2-iminopropanoate deaminase